MRRLLLAAGLLLAAAPAFAAMQTRPVEWTQGGDHFSGYVVYDDASQAPRPGLLMVPDWYGVTPAALDKARQQAGRDYVVFVVDMYGKGVRPADDRQALAQVKMLYPKPALMRARMRAALEAFKSQAGKVPLDSTRIGAFGFCFGGSSVLELARSGAKLAGIVTFHGGLHTESPAAPGSVKTPLLVLNGAADESQKTAIVPFEQEMDRAGADWTFVNFSGAVHCFALETANKPGCKYDPRAARRAYAMMHQFFDEQFGRPR
ncbi:dienelactone hydrolase family protein [Thermomonas sp. S9]|uniref:dienelactone hydrolase family protein n=1 Tax=Thermomonas sp. S9 TaxID=2885203 RepID=UPI00216AC62A|nr:dienelactone hydrolase family protein [Thermomonas sp. S9]MCR6495615.1 dienelactone hydrolase family protein [Thermomonas sp. S9]